MNEFCASIESKAIAASLYNAYSNTLSERSLKEILSNYFRDSTEDESSARSFVNRFILKHYPNEMTIRSNFINNTLLPLQADAISIFELPVGKSRVDICRINGSSTAYEIKTDLDSFCRLESQLDDYLDVFELVYIITSESRWKELPNHVPQQCGIYSYRQRDDGTFVFHCRRKAKKTSSLDPKKQLNAMAKRAICELIHTDTSIDKEIAIEKCLSSHSPQQINRAFKNYLKKRYESNWSHLRINHSKMLEIDYEWFYRTKLDPEILY